MCNNTLLASTLEPLPSGNDSGAPQCEGEAEPKGDGDDVSRLMMGISRKWLCADTLKVVGGPAAFFAHLGGCLQASVGRCVSLLAMPAAPWPTWGKYKVVGKPRTGFVQSPSGKSCRLGTDKPCARYYCHLKCKHHEEISVISPTDHCSACSECAPATHLQ